MARGRSAIARFWRELGGVSAVEFAIGGPIVIILLLVGYDTTRYVIATQRVQNVASTIGQMVSVSTTGQLTPADLQFYQDSTMVIFPLVLQDSFSKKVSWTNDINITVSSINFTGTSPNYSASTKWSAGSNLRPCKPPLIAVADTAPPSPTTLPTDTFGPGTLIVIDVTFSFRPTIAATFMTALPISRSFYVQPRYVPSIAFTGLQSGTVNQC